MPSEKSPVGRAPKPRAPRAPKERPVGKVPNPRTPKVVRDVGGGNLRDLFALFPDLPRPSHPRHRRPVPRIPRLR